MGDTDNEESCEHNYSTVAACAARITRGHWSCLGPGSESPKDDLWNNVADLMMINFRESGDLVWPATAVLLPRVMISADWCPKLAQLTADHSSSSTGNPVVEVNNDSESQVASADVSILTRSSMFNVGARGILLQQHNKERSENLLEDVQVTKACDYAGLTNNS